MGVFFGTTNLNDGVKPKDPLSLDYPMPDLSRIKMDRNGTLDNFTTLTLRAMKFFQQKILKRDPNTWVPLVAGYPYQKIQEASFIKTRSNINDFNDFYFLYPFADLVTYTVKYQGPAGFKEAFGKERMRQPQYRETVRVEEIPGLLYEITSAPMDNLIQFDCWSSTGRGADNLTAWFKYFMEFMKGSIMRQGFDKIQFWERGVDADVTAWRDDIAVRSIQYYVRTQEFSVVPTSLITAINAELAVTSSFDDQVNDFVREIRGIPLNSGCIAPSSVPLISGLQSIGTVALLDNTC